jgi:NTP pyrophosphatase (non-canonical NTP hydrolase)
MQIREYQDWVENWDRERGWHRVNPSHTLLHAFEEMGEIARIVLQMEGYKEGGSPASLSENLSSELSDLLVFIFKLAYQCGVDIEDALVAGQSKAEQRYGDLSAAAQELARYLNRQTDILNEITGHSDSADSRHENGD